MLRMVMDVARGMRYLHELNHFDEVDAQDYSGIIHRLLTPTQCLVGDFACVKINNFSNSHSIGRYSDDGEGRGGGGDGLFTAPELVLCEAYSEKVDVYSFGMILATLAISGSSLVEYLKLKFRQQLTASHPLREKVIDSTVDVVKLICSRQFEVFNVEHEEKTSGGYTAVPEMLFKLISKCVSFTPSDRPCFSEIMEYLHFKCEVELENMNTLQTATHHSVLKHKAREVETTEDKGMEDIERNSKASLSFSHYDQTSLLPPPVSHPNTVKQELTVSEVAESSNLNSNMKRKSSFRSSTAPSLVKKTVQLQIPEA